MSRKLLRHTADLWDGNGFPEEASDVRKKQEVCLKRQRGRGCGLGSEVCVEHRGHGWATEKALTRAAVRKPGCRRYGRVAGEEGAARAHRDVC